MSDTKPELWAKRLEECLTARDPHDPMPYPYLDTGCDMDVWESGVRWAVKWITRPENAGPDWPFT